MPHPSVFSGGENSRTLKAGALLASRPNTMLQSSMVKSGVASRVKWTSREHDRRCQVRKEVLHWSAVMASCVNTTGYLRSAAFQDLETRAMVLALQDSCRSVSCSHIPLVPDGSVVRGVLKSSQVLVMLAMPLSW